MILRKDFSYAYPDDGLFHDYVVSPYANALLTVLYDITSGDIVFSPDTKTWNTVGVYIFTSAGLMMLYKGIGKVGGGYSEEDVKYIRERIEIFPHYTLSFYYKNFLDRIVRVDISARDFLSAFAYKLL
ncbi:MAG: hypothetical protein QXX12_05670 [Nanopusillaceae archaeon]